MFLSKMYLDEGEFKLGCKVPDHNGPLGSGWEANSKYSESIIISRRTNPDVPDGELDPNEFGIWTEFASCLKNVLELLEGQAYFKETEVLKSRYGHINTNKPPVSDDGTENGEEHSEELVIAGAIVGSSNSARNHSSALFNRISSNRRDFHGAGLRYNEAEDGSDALKLECFKFLPDQVKDKPLLHPLRIQVESFNSIRSFFLFEGADLFNNYSPTLTWT